MKKTRQKLTFFKIELKNLKTLDNRKLQYDLMLLEGVLRAHVSPNNEAVVIAKPETKAEKILSAIPKKYNPKVLNQESINHNELLKKTFNI